MANNHALKVIVATSSVIIRSGLAAVLKRIPDLNIQAVEVSNTDFLQNYALTQVPDIMIIDPTLGGWFDIAEFKTSHPKLSGMKFVAVIASVIDSKQLKDYHDTIAIYDSADTIAEKLNALMKSEDDKDIEQESLSQREKEIIILVVKGLTNKEIADKLYLSIHTVITHRRNIARKLQIHSSAGLTIYAIVNKLVELKDIEKGKSL
ncbi:MAG: response regulator transcription factor [Bacteroidaceae bacterium]|nr:response regulator transcription factor [Bacteroidaceae bacterium]